MTNQRPALPGVVLAPLLQAGQHATEEPVEAGREAGALEYVVRKNIR